MATPTTPTQVKISDVRALLKQGYTRWENEALEPTKSIQAHYSLSFSDCKILFAHPKIKGLKTRVVTLQIIDDTEDGDGTVTDVTEEMEEAEEQVATPQAVEELLTGAQPVEVPASEPVPTEPEPESLPAANNADEASVFDVQ